MSQPSHPSDPILFYDGLCGLCDHFVRFVLDHDSRKRIRFASIQGPRGSALLRANGVTEEELRELSTVFFLKDGILHRRSRAAFHVFSLLPLPWRIPGILRLLPAFPADLVYRLVSRTRYRWFGKLDKCRLPDPSEKDRFLE